MATSSPSPPSKLEPEIELSIVIPTRDRPDRLTETLGAIETEITGSVVEVVVVDDGSAPGSLDSLRQRPWSFPIRWLEQEGRGPATARNRGVATARGARVLFLGDDTRPAPGCLDRHRGAAEGVQGHIDWDPDQPISPVMEFLAPAGPQFYFAGLSPGEPVPYTAVLGSNASFPRSWLIDEPYDEGFPAAALEDTEHAHRLTARGWRAFYEPQALCWHHHPYPGLAPFLARQRRAGRAARYALRRRPALAWRVALQPLLFTPLVVGRWLLARSPEIRRRQGWDLRCRSAFFRGLAGI